MFGYVRTDVFELRVKEHEYYKGTYCGLCKAMGRCTGQCSRMSLNYDFAMFALARFALSKTETSFSQKRCIVHPLKKRNIMNGNGELDYCAHASSLITYHKVRDDLADEGFGKRLFVRMFLLPFASGMRKKTVKSKKEYRELDEKCLDILGQVSEMERAKVASVDLPARKFGELLGEFMAFGLEGNEKKIGYNIGLHLGHWIYIADALDDIEDDAKKGSYNPFLLIYDGKLPSAEQASDIALALKNELVELENAIDLVDFSSHATVKEIIRNIIYLGMPKKIEAIAEKFSTAAKADS